MISSHAEKKPFFLSIPFLNSRTMAKNEPQAEEIIMEKSLGAISPPKLENAGLENCALPTESIIEAFSRAAISVKSRIVSPSSGDQTLDGECVHNPTPSGGQIAGEILPPMGESDFGGKRGCVVDGVGVPGGKNGDGVGGDLDDDEESEEGAVLGGGFV